MTWQPSASIDAIHARAHFYRYLREYFYLHNVLEVDTPMLSHAGVSDPYLYPIEANCLGKKVFLPTSPEYPMKRLLASGTRDIYQICKVFRDQEQGSRHNPEFSMLEYYRLNFDLKSLMDDVASLIGDYLNIQNRIDFDYCNVMMRYANVNPFDISLQALKGVCEPYIGTELVLDRDGYLDILMTHCVEPNLPSDTLVFIEKYPASQAALAKIERDHNGNQVASRFELYVNGVELANGYHELSDSVEQNHRFTLDCQKQPAPSRPIDNHLLSALSYGLPECSGVALGLDRILMLKLQVDDISQVISFEFNRA